MGAAVGERVGIRKLRQVVVRTGDRSRFHVIEGDSNSPSAATRPLIKDSPLKKDTGL
jgi:hypothetical protein